MTNSTGTTKQKPKGIRRKFDRAGVALGWEAYVRVSGKWKSKLFPLTTAHAVMRRWRNEQKARAQFGSVLPAPETTFVEDVAAYLEQVATMKTLPWRKADLLLWLAVFGEDRDRRTITAGEIRAQLERWRAAGYAANTVNHRRTALMHLFTVLDGKSAQNPARDVPRYADDSQDAPPRALSPAAVAAVFEQMPASQTRARLELMRWSGWPHAQIARLEPADVRWNDAVYVRPRRKGKGAAGVWLPLLPAGWAALRAFKACGAWGNFSASSARKSFRLAAKKVADDPEQPEALRRELANVTPYQLRHSFGTLIAGITTDDRAVQTLMQHADIRQTHRYTKATADPRAAAALRKVGIELEQTPKAP